jgi:hypothetical protein
MSSVSQLTTIKKDRLVGIIAKGNQHIFSNGIVQNAYFIYECLEKIGLRCQFLSVEPSSTFGYRDLSIKQISSNPLEFDPSEYHTIISVTTGLTKQEYEICKANKVFVVTFACGNQLEYNIEEFVRGSITPGVHTFLGKNTFSDEIWIIPSMKYSLDYISIIRNKPTFVAPHLWSPALVIDEAIRRKKTDGDLLYDHTRHAGKGIDILILESNLHFTKTSWIPLVGCEKLHIDDPSLIDNIYVFNMPEQTLSYKMIDDLAVGNKVRKFKRLSLPEIFLHFNEKGSMPIIVSHQINVSLNYLFYEALYFGWPLVHNSPDLEGCGYFYQSSDIVGCAEAIKNAFTHHNKNASLYLEQSRAYLKRVDPHDETVCKKFSGMIDAGICKSFS